MAFALQMTERALCFQICIPLSDTCIVPIPLISIHLAITTHRKGAEHERRTDILKHTEVVKIKHEEMIEDYYVKLFFTNHQYLKKITLVSLRSSGEQKLKDEDQIIQEIDGIMKMDIFRYLCIMEM